MLSRRWALFSLVLVCSCCTRRHVPIASTSEPIPREYPEVAFKVLAPEAKQSSEDVSYAWPVAKAKLTPPEYPAAALAKQTGPVTVGVRIVIGTEGSVTELIESPRVPSTPSPFLPEFRAAVETAVKTWQFTPAEWRFLEDGSDLDGDGQPDFKRVFARQAIPVYCDVQFDFWISEDKPQVGISRGP